MCGVTRGWFFAQRLFVAPYFGPPALLGWEVKSWAAQAMQGISHSSSQPMPASGALSHQYPLTLIHKSTWPASTLCFHAPPSGVSCSGRRPTVLPLRCRMRRLGCGPASGARSTRRAPGRARSSRRLPTHGSWSAWWTTTTSRATYLGS